MAPPDSEAGDRSWDQYRRLILSELERMNATIEAINRKIETFRQEDIASIRTDIALLKFQAAMWGAGAGIVFSGLVALASKFLGH
jgi:hypothetical protein